MTYKNYWIQVMKGTFNMSLRARTYKKYATATKS